MKTLKELEKEAIMSRLGEMKGNISHTARSLGLGIRTVQRKLTRYGFRYDPKIKGRRYTGEGKNEET